MARRVFFSFDYEDVKSFRVNVVRNHSLTKDGNGGYFDASIWEDAKSHGDAGLKTLIDTSLGQTSVTAVLIGTRTASRRWVQYEVFQSIKRGNGVFGIHINSILDRDQRVKTRGPSPFGSLALRIDQNGTVATPLIHDGSTWVASKDCAPFTVKSRPASERGQAFQLTQWYSVYDWSMTTDSRTFRNGLGEVTISPRFQTRLGK